MEKVTGLDIILQELGPFKTFNVISYLILLVPIYLCGMYTTIYVFELSDIKYRCNITECEHVTNYSEWLEYAIPTENDALSRCHRYPSREIYANESSCSVDVFDRSYVEECTSFVYADGSSSAVKDLDLGCKNWRISLVGTARSLGILFALSITGFVSDRHGRKITLILASIFCGIFGIARSFATSYMAMISLEFLEALLGGGTYCTAFVLGMELVGPNGRVFGNTLINVVYDIGSMTSSALAWYFQDWRILLQVIYVPAFVSLLYFLFPFESIRWLLSKGRHKEAISIIRKAAKMNRVDLPEELLLPLQQTDKEYKNVDSKDIEIVALNGGDIEEKKETNSTIITVMKSKVLRNRTIICAYLWLTCSLVYYGLSLNSVLLAGNMYVNFMLMGFVDIPANCLCYMVLDKFGRKKTLITNYLLSACLCISMAFLPKDDKVWPLIFFLCGKFSITIAYSSIYVYVSEVFPTNVRTSLVAFCSGVARLSSAFAPLTPLLALYYHNLPAIVFGAFAFVATLMVLTLPETKNATLPDTIEDALMISRKKETTA